MIWFRIFRWSDETRAYYWERRLAWARKFGASPDEIRSLQREAEADKERHRTTEACVPYESKCPASTIPTESLASPPNYRRPKCQGCGSHSCCGYMHRVLRRVKQPNPPEILSQAKEKGQHACFVLGEDAWLFGGDLEVKGLVLKSSNSSWYEEFRIWLGARKHENIMARITKTRAFIYAMMKDQIDTNPTVRDKLWEDWGHLPVCQEFLEWANYSHMTQSGQEGGSSKDVIPPPPYRATDSE